ncbi:NUDIX domain-containing protein [Asticcacaulis taihuensis]|uniref:GDP-mannose pyrophosphatase n=1 Tax=Asticcacaulis taihuensis TaxID=260084 RepID=A0A1G4SBR6_9CAUL|nr:NUDIX hydrolase [Asticcacaulis taihuensis]SCW66397.1 8-oxo-dGTP pyrophosphatase MutT, NUDIX family [Asticcacaulis taihuensis]
MPDKTVKRPPWDSEARAVARPRWQSVTSQTVFHNPWIQIESHDVIAPTGNPAHYGLVKFANRAIAVLPLHDDGTVSLVGQARFAVNAYSWELPEGGGPHDEDPRDAAIRELREETGLVAANLREILSFDMSNSVTDEVAVCFLATGLSQSDIAPDETEAFEYARVPFKDLLDAVIKGQVRDGLTVVSVLRVYHMAVSGDLPPHLRDAILD